MVSILTVAIEEVRRFIVSEPDPRKIEKRVWEIGLGGSVHCARNAGALPIDS